MSRERLSDFLALKGISKAPLTLIQLKYPPSLNTVFIMSIGCLPKLLLFLTSSLVVIWKNVLGTEQNHDRKYADK